MTKFFNSAARDKCGIHQRKTYLSTLDIFWQYQKLFLPSLLSHCGQLVSVIRQLPNHELGLCSNLRQVFGTFCQSWNLCPTRICIQWLNDKDFFFYFLFTLELDADHLFMSFSNIYLLGWTHFCQLVSQCIRHVNAEPQNWLCFKPCQKFGITCIRQEILSVITMY